MSSGPRAARPGNGRSQGAFRQTGNVGQRQIVSADQADRASGGERTDNAFRPAAPVPGIRSLQQLIQQKQQLRLPSARSKSWRSRVISA